MKNYETDIEVTNAELEKSIALYEARDDNEPDDPEEIERMCAEAEAMREEDEMLQKQREIDGYMD